MSRLFWITLGATAGVLVVRKLTHAAESLTPGGTADRVADGLTALQRTVREFADDVRVGMAERDTELRRALGLASDGLSAADQPDPDTAADLFRTHAKGTY